MAKTKLLYLKNGGGGGLGSYGFHIKLILGTQDNWKNLNPGLPAKQHRQFGSFLR